MLEISVSAKELIGLIIVAGMVRIVIEIALGGRDG